MLNATMFPSVIAHQLHNFFKESNCIIFVWISIGFVLLCLNDTFMSCYLIEFYVLFVGLLNSEDDKPPRLWRILTLLNSSVFSSIPFLFFLLCTRFSFLL